MGHTFPIIYMCIIHCIRSYTLTECFLDNVIGDCFQVLLTRVKSRFNPRTMYLKRSREVVYGCMADFALEALSERYLGTGGLRLGSYW